MKYLMMLAALTACAPQQPIYKPVAVDIPVAQAAHAETVGKPDFALSHSAPGDDLASKTKAALIEITQRKSYEAELEAQLTLCR